jgi:hypothetical protein
VATAGLLAPGSSFAPPSQTHIQWQRLEVAFPVTVASTASAYHRLPEHPGLSETTRTPTVARQTTSLDPLGANERTGARSLRPSLLVQRVGTVNSQHLGGKRAHGGVPSHWTTFNWWATRRRPTSTSSRFPPNLACDQFQLVKFDDYNRRASLILLAGAQILHSTLPLSAYSWSDP